MHGKFKDRPRRIVVKNCYHLPVQPLIKQRRTSPCFNGKMMLEKMNKISQETSKEIKETLDKIDEIIIKR